MNIAPAPRNLTRRYARIGTITRSKHVKHITQQRVTVGNKTMTITEYHTDWYITIYLGSPTTYSVKIRLSKDTDWIWHQYGTLKDIRWDGECQFTDTFEEGTDTFMMIHVAMTYVRRSYPAVKELTYTDLSSKEYEQRAVLSLCALKIFTEGPSWYETRLPMRMDPSFDDTYRIIMDRTDRQKRDMPWKEFIFCTGYHPTILGIDRIQETYESCQTWQEFFRYLRSQLDTDTLIACLTTDDWFDSFILKRMQFQVRGVQFLIEPSSYDMEYTLEPMEEGKAVRPSKGVQRWRHTLRKRKE